MVSSISCAVYSRWNPLTFQFVLFFCCLNFGSVESFRFIESDQFIPDLVRIETNGSTNYTISCLTDDPNASTMLLFSKNSPPGKELPTGGRITLHRQIYVIHGLTVGDKGVYTCKAISSQSGETITKILFLILNQEKIPCCPTVSPDNKIMSPGTTANFVCHVDLVRFNAMGKYLTFKWYKKEEGNFIEIPSNETQRRSKNSSVLMIRNAKATPEGGTLYKCEIWYKGKSSFFLGPLVAVHELSKPTVSELPDTVVVNRTKKLQLRCKADGYPVPTITWLRNGSQMPVCIITDMDNCTGKNYRVLQDRNEIYAYMESVLTIETTEYPKDSGTYTCKAENIASVLKNVEVSIQTQPSLVKPSIYWLSRRVLPCELVTQSSPFPTFKWQFQSGSCLHRDLHCKPSPDKWQTLPAEFAVSPPSTVATAKSTLTIPEAAPSSFFRCIATNPLGSDDWTLTFLASGEFNVITMTSKRTQFDEGETLKLECIMLRNGSVIGWYKNGQLLKPTTDARIAKSWAAEPYRTWMILEVERLTTNDSGVYTCSAQDTIGQIFNDSSKLITINKVYPPTIHSFKGQDPYRETTVRLQCNITAHPTPEVKWLKDNKSLDNIKEENKLEPCEAFARGIMYRVKDRVGLLVICNPSHAQQTGFYTCQASNRAGKSSATAFLDVLEDPVIVSPSKEMTKRPVRVDIGKPWNATCKARGNPAPLVEWRKATADKSLTQKRVDSNGVVLNIPAMHRDDSGFYICVAENSKGKVTARIELVTDELLPDPVESKGLSKETVIGISVVAGALFIVILVAISCLVFIRHQRKQILEYRSQFFPEYIGEHQIDPDRTLLEQCSNLPYDPVWEFPEERVILGEALGSGAFGQVIKAEALGIADFNPRVKSAETVQRRSKRFRRSSSSKRYVDAKGIPYLKTTVAVKTLKANATKEEYRDLASELKILIHVGEHKNIVNLLGACTKGERLLVIMEFAPHGNLRNFLRSKRFMYEPIWGKSSNNPEIEFNIAHLVAYCYQVCRGMEFLASKKCIHRDLAARNVLVGEDYVIKIADFGLARDIYKSEVYVKATSGILPVKWMALESLFLREYSEKSDVWSFGVCLWEIFTLGGSPYPGVPTEDLLDRLSDGHRMESPQDCPAEIYSAMNDCWRKEVEQRPSFAELSERIGKIIEENVSKEGYQAYIRFTGDSKGDQSDYLNPEESDSPAPQREAVGYSGLSSEDIAHSPLPPLPAGTEHEWELEADERERMLEPEASGSQSGNESGIDMAENGNEIAVAMEMTPMASTIGKVRKKSSSKQPFV